VYVLSGERLCRFQGASTAAQISGAVVALPVIATALLAAFGSAYAVAAYILFCSIVSIIATALLPDYTNRDISGEDA
jgi:hypothetical protein